jgi:hypothetical protein
MVGHHLLAKLLQIIVGGAVDGDLPGLDFAHAANCGIIYELPVGIGEIAAGGGGYAILTCVGGRSVVAGTSGQKADRRQDCHGFDHASPLLGLGPRGQ